MDEDVCGIIGVITITHQCSDGATPFNSSHMSTVKIAIEGCAHGELDEIYASIAVLEQKEGVKVDLLICCGDFQARAPRSINTTFNQHRHLYISF